MLLAIALIAGCGGKGLKLSSIKDATPGVKEGADAVTVADAVAAGDSPIGNGGASGSKGAGANGGAGGKARTSGTSSFGGAPGAGGLPGSGAAKGSGGEPGSGGVRGTGGLTGTEVTLRTGGAPETGGPGGAGGTSGSGGLPATGGTSGSGGLPATGGATATAGTAGTGGRSATGGTTGIGGGAATGGTTATGGSVATGGTSGTGGTTFACSVGSPPTDGTSHCDSNATGSYSSYQWSLFQNGNGGCLITYANADAAFSATWNNSGDFLARVGFEWDGTKTYDQLGTITAQFAEAKTGTDGGYSYIGIYGLSVSPCVEFYIVDDSFNAMPIKPYGGNKIGAAVVDGATYTFYTGAMTGTATAFCSASHTQPWTQMWSVRETARQCGQISITDHFNEWRKIGITIGNMVETVLVVETLGGSGRVDFTTGSMTAQ